MTVQMWLDGAHWIFTQDQFEQLCEELPEGGFWDLTRSQQDALVAKYGQKAGE